MRSLVFLDQKITVMSSMTNKCLSDTVVDVVFTISVEF